MGEKFATADGGFRDRHVSAKHTIFGHRHNELL